MERIFPVRNLQKQETDVVRLSQFSQIPERAVSVPSASDCFRKCKSEFLVE